MSNLGLIFDGTIDLLGEAFEDEGYRFRALGDGATQFGNAQPVEVVLSSLLKDGSIVAWERDENREATVAIQIQGHDSQALALGHKRLSLALRKPTTLAYTPPDGFGATTVFKVLTSSLSRPEFDDLAELRNQRTYLLRLVCEPYTRSETLTVDDAGTPPSSGGSVFLACESTSGWAGFGSTSTAPAFTVDSTIFSQGTGSVKSLMTEWEPGRVYNTGNGTGGYLSPAQGRSRDEVTGLGVATGTGGYVSVRVRGESANTTTLTRVWMSTTAGVWTLVPSFAALAIDAAGFVRYVWEVAAGLTVLGLRFEVEQRRQTDNVPRPYTWYDGFELLPSATTDHQIVKMLDVGGSARAPGSLHIEAPNDAVALGSVLAITTAASAVRPGFQPDGRRWATQGTLSTDGTALDGSHYTPDLSTYSAASGKPIFDVPVAMLNPGPYTIVALVKPNTSTASFGVRSQLRLAGTTVGPTSEVEVATAGTADAWQFVTVGTVYLPPLPVQGPDSDATVRLLFKGDRMANIYMIPATQPGGLTVADYTVVDCGTGAVSAQGASSHLWIDSPSLEQPRGGIWRGPVTGRLNAKSAWPDVKKPGRHTFPPGPLLAFLISTGAQGPKLTLEYFHHWLGDAAS